MLGEENEGFYAIMRNFQTERLVMGAMAIAEAIEGAGGGLNAYTTKEITCFWNHLPFEKLDEHFSSVAAELEVLRRKTVPSGTNMITADQPGEVVYVDGGFHVMGVPLIEG